MLTALWPPTHKPGITREWYFAWTFGQAHRQRHPPPLAVGNSRREEAGGSTGERLGRFPMNPFFEDQGKLI